LPSAPISHLQRHSRPSLRLLPLRASACPSPAAKPPLSTLHSPLSPLPSPLSTLHSPLSTLHSPLSTLHSPLSTLYSPLSTLPSPLSTLHSPLSTLHSPLSTLYSLLSTLYSLLSATPALPNPQPSGANRSEAQIAAGKQPAKGCPQGEAGGPRQSAIPLPLPLEPRTANERDSLQFPRQPEQLFPNRLGQVKTRFQIKLIQAWTHRTNQALPLCQ